ncbi:MAG: PEP-CTERM sorting domain-containing protein [Verrucomicrobia bacterium]|nr:PEP-CTERM sorting domain-containing protein [Verrucomicrobiota bacterium]
MVIPDGNLSGIALSQTISTSSILSLDDVEVTLNISGGLNGDYYVYLVHSTPGGTGFSVLLNRVGRTTGSPFGYGDSGLTVTFSGSALNDIHTYQTVTNPGGGALTGGTWSPDARNVDPATVDTIDPRTATLASFNGLNANGTWTLFVADVASLGQGTLISWGLHLQGVPEPGTVAAGAVGALLVAAGWRRRRREG